MKNISFTGIFPRYQNPYGFKVYPISQNPSQRDINKAIDITKRENGYSGCNGIAYMWGEDLVVKKYKPSTEAINYDPMKEINSLDTIYEEKINVGNNSQRGLYGFETPDGETYLVSTRVLGEAPNGKKGNLNKQNLLELVKIFTQMDIGTLQNSDEKRFMHYDLSQGNIKVTPNGAGLFDFEYSSQINSSEEEALQKDPNFISTNPSCSDTRLISSNLRDFEYRTLYRYLTKVENPQETFIMYLGAKSFYHQAMAEKYEKQNNIQQAGQERCHANLLEETNLYPDKNKDIIKAEAIKIQMARFLFATSGYDAFGKYNPKQIIEYIDDSIIFFKNALQEAKDKKDTNRITYYQNCLNLSKIWNNKKGFLYYFSEPLIIMDFWPDFVKEMRKLEYEEIQTKFVKDRAITVDQLVCS